MASFLWWCRHVGWHCRQGRDGQCSIFIKLLLCSQILEVGNYFESKECDANTSFVKFKVKRTTTIMNKWGPSWEIHLWHCPMYRPYSECALTLEIQTVVYVFHGLTMSLTTRFSFVCFSVCGYTVIADKKADGVWHSMQQRVRAPYFLNDCWGLTDNSLDPSPGENIFIGTITRSLSCTLTRRRTVQD